MSDFENFREVLEWLLDGGAISSNGINKIFLSPSDNIIEEPCPNDQYCVATCGVELDSQIAYQKYVDLPKWYENIPKQGILCWVWGHEHLKCLHIVKYFYGHASTHPFGTDSLHMQHNWKFARPVTPAELEDIIYRGNEKI